METGSEYKYRLPLGVPKHGYERRLQLQNKILEYGTPMPSTVEYDDIDAEFRKWADETLAFSFDGDRLPTYLLMSNQRISEYVQRWFALDRNGNASMNFKTVNRELNPEKGTILGDIKNIPGNRYWAIGYVPVMQENGLTGYDRYEMRQPTQVDLSYRVAMVSNKIEAVNKFNQKVLQEFSALYSYICPKGHYMPVELSSVSDDTEYSIDDRRYYCQTYSFTVKAYIITEEDLRVTHCPIRVSVDFGVEGKRNGRGKEIEVCANPCNCVEDDGKRYCGVEIRIEVPKRRAIDELCEPKIVREYKYSEKYACVVNNIETLNVRNLKVYVNGEDAEGDEGCVILEGDIIRIEFERMDYEKSSFVKIYGYDHECVIDSDTEAKDAEIVPM